MKTVTGTLPHGVEVDGVMHREFELGQPLLKHNIDAIDDVGADNVLKLSAAMTARQLVKLGTLPTDKITYELISNLHIEDWNALDAAAAELSKKPEPPKSGSPGSTSSPLP